ncbi:hypothetical protein GCM10023144_37200 [Pigmentiphaga soli]|uniref:Uncharacterized protein n=1 Tax=Pigmentiphaga soli TaxID=1007095 RepID=A0ABP8HHA5_9BURK
MAADLALTFADRIERDVMLVMGEHFHYTPFIAEMTALLRHGSSAVVPGGRFCMTWGEAAKVAAHALDFIGQAPAAR